MQDQITHFDVNNITYPLAFTLNVLEEIQNKYGSYEQWGKLIEGKKQEINIEAVKFGITEMINEGIDIENEEKQEKRDFVTSKQVGRIITTLGLKDTAKKIHEVVTDSSKVEEEQKNV